ncbi:MAG: hypothetical protein RSB04_11595 [Gordonibacter sp.]|uniref:hypothetical protein n=1 Tax=Gordonibacter sp. TaxID=1968902 RepID=UPI002FC5ADA7
MKKVVAVVSVLVLTFSLVGCGSQAPAKEEPQSEQPKVEEVPEAASFEDSLGVLSYTVPAGWTKDDSAEGTRTYRNGESMIMVASFEAPADLSAVDDTVLQLALVSSLKSWDAMATGGLKTDKQLVDVNGLKMQNAGLLTMQNGANQDVLLSTFFKGGSVFQLIFSIPEASDAGEPLKGWNALLATCR